jgi:hypothetical protein
LQAPEKKIGMSLGISYRKLTVTVLFVLFFLLLLCNLGHTRSFAGEKTYDFEEIKNETIDGVIVPQERAIGFYSGNKIKGYFTPLKEDILKAESKILDYIRGNTPQARGYPYAPDIDKKLANYKRQYVGAIFKDNKRKIWINFFCNSGNDSWKSSPFSVIGGGACYFNVLYDIDSGLYSNLRINGVIIKTKNNIGPSDKK